MVGDFSMSQTIAALRFTGPILAEKLPEDALNILRDRYGYVRQEILARIDTRYKITQFLYAFVPVVVGAAVGFGIWALALMGCALVFSSCILFIGESRAIVALGDYLLMLERQLQKVVSLPGWEQHSRDVAIKKGGSTGWLMFAFLSIYIVSYTALNALGAFLIPGADWWTWNVFLAAELLMLIPPVWGSRGYSTFWLRDNVPAGSAGAD
jgi:hypothetical protein